MKSGATTRSATAASPVSSTRKDSSTTSLFCSALIGLSICGTDLNMTNSCARSHGTTRAAALGLVESGLTAQSRKVEEEVRQPVNTLL
jgi:hypothetical protein